MKLLSLLLCVAVPVFAAEPVKPVLDVPVPEATLLPDGSVVMPAGRAVLVAQHLKACDAERAELKAAFPGAAPMVVAIISGVVLLGAGVALGYVVGASVKPQP